jgi:hypothetical protein
MELGESILWNLPNNTSKPINKFLPENPISPALIDGIYRITKRKK